MNVTAESFARPPVEASPRTGFGAALVRVASQLYRHRALVVALLGRQLKARYRGSILGFVWTFLNPLLLMAVYALVFRFYLRVAVPHYAIFLLSGLLPWMWFSASLSEGANAVVAGGALVTKSLFPAEILPTVVVLAHMVNFLFGLPLLIGAAVFLGMMPRPELWLALPVIVVLQLAFTLGLVLALAALNVHYRDVQHILANVLVFWFFLTPIVYPASQIPETLRPLLFLNPLALFADAYHRLLVTLEWPALDLLGAIVAYSAASLAIGSRVFDAYRDTFAEVV